MKNFFNLKAKDIAIIVLIIGILIGGSIFFKRESNWKTKYNLEVNLKNALEDSVRTYQNKEGEWVVEKLTLQADISTLEDDNLNLTENQKTLLRRIKALDKNVDIINAANLKQKAIIDSLMDVASYVDTVNHTATFERVSDTLVYDIKILNVKPSDKGRATMLIKKLEIPNELFIEFHWNEAKTKAIEVSVTNTNPMYKTNDIDSYAIPELIKEEIDPTGWQKVKKWFKSNGQKVGIFLGGAVIGGLVIGASG